jgi:hypothetical protein
VDGTFSDPVAWARAYAAGTDIEAGKTAAFEGLKMLLLHIKEPKKVSMCGQDPVEGLCG